MTSITTITGATKRKHDTLDNDPRKRRRLHSFEEALERLYERQVPLC
jgi:hypothetical protein